MDKTEYKVVVIEKETNSVFYESKPQNEKWKAECIARSLKANDMNYGRDKIFKIEQVS